MFDVMLGSPPIIVLAQGIEGLRITVLTGELARALNHVAISWFAIGHHLLESHRRYKWPRRLPIDNGIREPIFRKCDGSWHQLDSPPLSPNVRRAGSTLLAWRLRQT